MLEELVKQRQINHVFHFTRLQNLDNILKEGLLSKTELDGRDAVYEFNDPYRLDFETNAICSSIGHPNYKMFYGLRQNNPNVYNVPRNLDQSLRW
jgi:hypothetical protein